MKKKIILSLVACLFAGLSVLNLGIARSSDRGDTTLDLISVMAKAYDEVSRSQIEPRCYSRWLFDYVQGEPYVEIFKCGKYPDDLNCYYAYVQRPQDMEFCQY